MREFVAVEVGAAPPGPGPRTAPHLTLRFLGEVAPDRNAGIGARLAAVAAESSPFVLRLEGIGAFPDTARPRVVWVGVTQGRTELAELARRVRDALTPEFGPDREGFVPHLTLFRVRSPADRTAAEELFRGLRPPPPAREVTVHELLLKESVLGPRGADHRTLASFRLGGPRPAAP
ncbi:MAG TPA: RNA 2',3'-cyclic phosphodiesterase [Thermoplasmata archaeon]|nr:RNA 2',3'-cyclic phosphodiesterase [Thermoplasmata archaeon]